MTNVCNFFKYLCIVQIHECIYANHHKSHTNDVIIYKIQSNCRVFLDVGSRTWSEKFGQWPDVLHQVGHHVRNYKIHGISSPKVYSFVGHVRLSCVSEIVKLAVYLIPKVNRFVNHVSVFPRETPHSSMKGAFWLVKCRCFWKTNAEYVPSNIRRVPWLVTCVGVYRLFIMHVELPFSIQDGPPCPTHLFRVVHAFSLIFVNHG